MVDWLGLFLDASLWVSALRIATPFLLGTTGELLCERVGVINLGIEGIMTVGAMSGWLVTLMTNQPWLGVLAAALAGLLLGLIHGAMTVLLGLSQHVVGIGISLFGVSLSSFLFRTAVPNAAGVKISAFKPVGFDWLEKVPFVGAILAQQTVLTFFAVALLAAVAYGLYRTPLGLAARMVGESPEAAAAQGINIGRVRMGGVALGSVFMGIAGCFLSLSAFNTFVINLVGGRGWICIALVVFASWKPGRILLGALFFAFVDALQLRLQQVVHGLPYQLFLMLPYLLSIVVLIGVSRRARAPQALMVPYRKGQR
ncbi:MAG TPA: ABC transporter permease [Burkholderiaceae bacterium]|nr:ABC transporter permease [Burkholderiaceae bacterium]